MFSQTASLEELKKNLKLSHDSNHGGNGGLSKVSHQLIVEASDAGFDFQGKGVNNMKMTKKPSMTGIIIKERALSNEFNNILTGTHNSPNKGQDVNK